MVLSDLYLVETKAQATYTDSVMHCSLTVLVFCHINGVPYVTCAYVASEGYLFDTCAYVASEDQVLAS